MKLLSEMFRNLRLPIGGKSEGKVPFKELLDKSKDFSEWRTEIGFTLPEILQLETLRYSNLVRFEIPEGRTARLLPERSRTLRLEKTERAEFVNLFDERFSV